MGSRLGDRPCYVFGAYRLDSNRCVIEALAGDRRLSLTPRVFDVAHYFVRHPGLLLSKDRLLAELWPGTAVEENTLTQAISLLRHALGESRGDNRYILTVPRHGYRFVADVSVTDGPSSDRPAGGLPDAHFRIEGRLQRAGQGLRITARLFDSTDDTVVWSQVFDCTTDGFFDIEDMVARSVASAVRRHVATTARPPALLELDARQLARRMR